MPVMLRGTYVVLTFMFLIGLSFVGHLYLFEQWRLQQERQLQRGHIKEEVLRLQHLSVEVETNFRGYLLTEQRAFLEPLETAEKRLNQATAELNRLTSQTPGLQAGVQILSARLKEFIDSKKQLAAVAGTGKRDQVQVYVRVGDGRALYLTVERAFRDFENRIERELPAESLEYEQWLQGAQWRLLLLEGAVLSLCIYTMRTVGRSKGAPPLPGSFHHLNGSVA
ncbi:MAG: CHASE3 domain-containing protein [Nitrospiraceae bacterium]|nr:CHASE3 domain-containing protein [Nitrospiraceae bacterium]